MGMPMRGRVEASASEALADLEALADSAVSATRDSAPGPRPPDGLAGFRAPRAGNHAFAGWAHRGPVCRLHSSYGTGSPAGHHRLGRANGVVLALSVRGTRENLIRLCG